jgi:ABC-type sugar transport system ATPase subunit
MGRVDLKWPKRYSASTCDRNDRGRRQGVRAPIPCKGAGEGTSSGLRKIAGLIKSFLDAVFAGIELDDPRLLEATRGYSHDRRSGSRSSADANTEFDIRVGSADGRASGGNQQKCVIARWLSGEPAIVI